MDDVHRPAPVDDAGPHPAPRPVDGPSVVGGPGHDVVRGVGTTLPEDPCAPNHPATSCRPAPPPTAAGRPRSTPAPTSRGPSPPCCGGAPTTPACAVPRATPWSSLLLRLADQADGCAGRCADAAHEVRVAAAETVRALAGDPPRGGPRWSGPPDPSATPGERSTYPAQSAA
ncbi:hypothetical protein GCM10025868_13920 [Angustibacter aerolatus]|uniref:Uncharacterized protein n=1 Tax=Angustibacter aerolatus TaxID=1162965 RepID=A0ABQ6JD76_9ACTN|nr:hypothetical protein GCM10025868_13920 [Angustibacter aerolatus]